MCKSKKFLIPLVCLLLIICVMFLLRGNEIMYVSLIIHNQLVKPDEVKMERIFEKDKSLLEEVSSVLLGIEGDFRIFGKYGSSALNEDANRLDPQTLKKVKKLGYSSILKTDNEVYFCYWENKNESRGFVYCTHTDIPKTPENLVHSKALGGNWHYLEDSKE